jgi:hypothetical protein
VVVSTWGEWKQAHPDTRIVARDGGIGRTYPDDPLCGRDDAGPIFPIGPADARLPVQAAVIGVIDSDGQPIAFAADAARAELAAGRDVMARGVELRGHSGDLRAYDGDERELVTHQAFWFAWSQFHPSTELWAPPPDETAIPPSSAAGPAGPLEGCTDLLDVLDR